MRLFHRFLQSLSGQLLLALSAVVAVVITVHAVVGFRTTQSEITRMITSETRRTSDLVRRATHDGMLLNQLGEVQTVLERMAQTPEVLTLRVFDKEGRIVLSGEPSEIGRRALLSGRTCSSCHYLGAPEIETISKRVGDHTEPAVRHLSVIPNEPSCASADCHAHPLEQTVLGVLDVEMSLAPAEAALASARRQLIRTSVVLLALTGGVSWWFVHRLVQKPTRQLAEAARRVASGDLKVRTDIRGHHELARFSRRFNVMIAELAEARRSVENWSRRLEGKVVEKTEELQRSQRQVLHMEKMASLGKLAATVAHELNNPLGGILTYARLCSRELESPDLSAEARQELLRYLEVIQRECARSGEIVRHLLLFARRGGEEKGPVDLSEAIRRSVQLVHHHIQLRQLDLEVEEQLEGALVWGNIGELEQALVALLVNGVEAMSREDHQTGGTLTVRMAEGSPGEVMIEIADTGVGIPSEIRQQIFEPFFSTKGRQSGVGLGLAVVYGIIQRHDGRIEVESEPDEGTVFRLHFPRYEPRQERLAEVAEVES